MERPMTKQITPTFKNLKTFKTIIFLIPKNYNLGVKLFITALVQPINIINFSSCMKISFLPTFKINRTMFLTNNKTS